MATLLPEPTALQAVVWPVLRTLEVLQVDVAHCLCIAYRDYHCTRMHQAPSLNM